MALATSGQMSLGGTTASRSIQLELGGSGSSTISMNDADVRALSGTAVNTTLAMSTLHGKSSGPAAQYLPVTVSGSNSVVDNNIPALIGANNNTQITGTTYWRRARVTYTGATGTKRLIVRPRRNGTATSYRGDIQAVMLIVTQSGNELEVPFVSASGATATGWEKGPIGTSAYGPSSWSAVNTTAVSNGQFYIRTNPYPTGSGGTGRLRNFIYTTRGYGFFETSGSTLTSAYYWLRSPTYYLTAGDTVDFYYGVDASSISEVAFYFQ